MDSSSPVKETAKPGLGSAAKDSKTPSHPAAEHDAGAAIDETRPQEAIEDQASTFKEGDMHDALDELFPAEHSPPRSDIPISSAALQSSPPMKMELTDVTVETNFTQVDEDKAELQTEPSSELPIFGGGSTAPAMAPSPEAVAMIASPSSSSTLSSSSSLSSSEYTAPNTAAAKVVKQGTQAQKEDGNMVGVPASPAVEGAPRAATIFKTTFPFGYIKLPTSPEGLLCGMEAIVKSGKALLPDISVPTVKDLQAIARGKEYKDQNAMFATEDELMNNTNYFGADQLALMLQLWGVTSGINLQLGYLTDANIPQLVPVADPTTARIIWIHNDDAEALGYLGHWSGIVPRTTPLLPKPTSPTLHQKQAEFKIENERYLWHQVLPPHQNVCPYALLDEDCLLLTGRCNMSQVCDEYGATGVCKNDYCYRTHQRYSCKAFIERGFCDKMDEMVHLRKFRHGGSGDSPVDRELEWTSREAHAALREAHSVGRYYYWG